MKKLQGFITIVLTMLITMGFAQLNDWYKLEKKEFGFKIDFPEKPKTKIWDADPKNGLDYKMYRFFSIPKDKNYVCYLFYSEYPDSLYNSNDINKDTLKILYDFIVDREVSSMSSGAKLISEKAITFKGYAGREAKIQHDEPVITIMKVFLIKDNLYIIGVDTDVNPQKDFTPLINRFFDSFDLLYL